MGSEVDAVGGWGGAALRTLLSDGSVIVPRSSLFGGALLRSRLHLPEQVHLAAVACLVVEPVEDCRAASSFWIAR